MFCVRNTFESSLLRSLSAACVLFLLFFQVMFVLQMGCKYTENKKEQCSICFVLEAYFTVAACTEGQNSKLFASKVRMNIFENSLKRNCLQVKFLLWSEEKMSQNYDLIHPLVPYKNIRGFQNHYPLMLPAWIMLKFFT